MQGRFAHRYVRGAAQWVIDRQLPVFVPERCRDAGGGVVVEELLLAGTAGTTGTAGLVGSELIDVFQVFLPLMRPVSSSKTRRPSMTCAIPCRTMSGADDRWIS